MSTLYIAATALQLIAVLNIRVNMNGAKGDLIIHETSVLNSHYIKDRIVETGLFDRVYLFADYDIRLNTIFTGKNSVLGWSKLVYKKHLHKMDINEFLIGDGRVELQNYDEVFCYNRKFTDILKQYPNVKINFIDDGVGSYTGEVVKSCEVAEKIYLYKPEFAVYYEKYKHKFQTIPALDARDIKFKKLLNQIWGYKDIKEIKDNAIIVFDQPCRITPEYFFCFPKFIRNNILAKTKLYKKYANDEKSKDFFISSIKKLQVKNDNVIVKIHPRSTAALRQQYIEEGFAVLENGSIPWEIIALNLNINKILLISMLSTVSLSMSLYFKNTSFEYKSAFLYKMAIDVAGIDVTKQTKLLLEKILPKINDTYVIGSNDELISLLIDKPNNKQ